MATLEAFDSEVKELVSSGKLSSSKIKSVTEAAMANIKSDAHLVATLFKVHKQAKSSHKISSLYVIDAIAREARQQVKKAAKGKQSNSSSTTPIQDGGSGINDDSDEPVLGKKSSKGTYASFLSKIESFLDRLVAEVLAKGPPEHKDKVKKVLDIWKKSATFSSDALKPCYARLSGEMPETDHKATRSHAHRPTAASSAQRSTTPPYPPPEQPYRFPSFPAQTLNAPTASTSQLPNATTPVPDLAQSSSLAALLGSISAAQSAASSTAEPVVQNAPAFEVSQLALLQQLAAQTAAGSPFAAPGQPESAAIPAVLPSAPPSQFPLPSQMPASGRPSIPTSSSSYQQHEQSSQPQNGWGERESQPGRQVSPVPPRRSRLSKWDRSEESNPRRGNDRRSLSPVNGRHDQSRQRSPPPRRKSPEYEANTQNRWGTHDTGRADFQTQPAQSRRPPPRQETRQIATYISEERGDGRPSNRQPARRPDEDEDYSSYEVPVQANQGSSQLNATVITESSDSRTAPEENQQANDMLSKAPMFNPMTFNALEPESWASFANMCQMNMGRMPTNMEMMQWIMSTMAMMQNASQMGGNMMMMGGMQDETGMNGGQMMSQQDYSQFDSSSGFGDDKQSRQGQAVRNRERDSSIGPDTRPPPPMRDDGAGEEDMKMTPDPA